MFKTLRTLWNLSQRVNEVEEQWANVRSEWADTLDLLTKREARERMRALRSVRASLEPDQQPTQAAPLPNGKAALRQRARASGLVPDPRGTVQ